MRSHRVNSADAGAALRVIPVQGRRAVRRFVQMPGAVLADDPAWVAPLVLERMQHLDPARNPYFTEAEAAFWIAQRGERPVGRISAQVDRTSLARYPDIGHFGFFDVEDSSETTAALLGAAEAWLSDRGMKRVRGPFSLSINDESGVLVDGFDAPPSLMMGHARPWYGQRLEEQGYAKARDLIAYRFDLERHSLPKSAESLVARLAEDPSIEVRAIRMADYGQELRRILEVFNDAWSENWGFVPFTDRAIDRTAKDLKPIIREELVCIAEVNGEPAAFGVGLPNLNEAIADLHGSLLPFGWARLLFRLKAGRIRSGRLPLMGVRRKYHGTFLGAALAWTVIDRLHRAFARLGFREAELSWILEDNLPMRRMIEATGAEAYKTYRVYEKALA